MFAPQDVSVDAESQSGSCTRGLPIPAGYTDACIHSAAKQQPTEYTGESQAEQANPRLVHTPKHISE